MARTGSYSSSIPLDAHIPTPIYLRRAQFIRELRHERGRCAVNSRVVSFGVYDLPVPFIKPGYFEVRPGRPPCNGISNLC